MLKSVGNPSTRYGDQTIVNGNLVIGTAGNGVDFSAASHAGGMTSELLDDYEEGTWTPTLGTDDTNFTSVTYQSTVAGRYTKVGNLVYVQGYMGTNAITVGSASGTVVIGNLPFTAVSNTSGKINGRGLAVIGQCDSLAGDHPAWGQVLAGTNLLALYYKSSVNGATLGLAPSDFATGAGSNAINFFAVYTVAT